MRDIQSGPPDVPIAVDRVGIKNFRLPLTVLDRANGRQHTVADVELSVDLPARFKGTHMRRRIRYSQSASALTDAGSLPVSGTS